MADIIYIDIESGLKRVMNNPKIYVKVLVKFKDDRNLEGIETALAAGDIEAAQIAVHTLKGLAANLSFTELYNQCVELEKQIKAKSVNPDQLASLKNTHSQTLIEMDKVIAQYA